MRCLPVFAALLALSSPALATVHEVKMLNRNDTGSMVFEPDFLRITPGDTVKFIATNPSHNAASIVGMMPEGAERFTGKINQDIEVTFDQIGTYGIKCTPHYAMGMVMLIEVGDGQPDPAAFPSALPTMAKKRFTEILGRIVSGQ